MSRLIDANFTDNAIAEFRRNQMENGFTFPLSATFAGWDEDGDNTEIPEARIRRISTLDQAVISSLPEEIQQTVWNGMKEFQEQQKKLQAAGEAQNLGEMFANNDKILKAATIFCRAAFIMPQLVQTPDQLGPGKWLEERVAPEDRVNVFIVCMDADSEAMKKLKVFRPERHLATANDAALQAPQVTLRAVESPSAGV